MYALLLPLERVDSVFFGPPELGMAATAEAMATSADDDDSDDDDDDGNDHCSHALGS